ncbi:MAG: hypothetical protein LBS69_02545 [Prevotellaceae bacterium]|jgi:hypothetical protein|nr:hypothetical protein [Prevotellaceae bacterium]
MKKNVLWHILLGLASIAVFVTFTMLLWNWLMPSIFGLKTITFWQALGLLAFVRILIGGMIGKHWMMNKVRCDRRYNSCFRRQFMKMSDEDRKDFIKRKFLKHGLDHDFFQQNESEKHD